MMSPAFSEAPNCQIILDNSNSETLALAEALDMPYGNSCLASQLEDADWGGALVAKADFCVCQEQFKKYQDHYFEGKTSPKAKAIMNAIEMETSFMTMKAFKSRLYEVQDTAIALDTMIRSQELDENTVYEVPECSANQLFVILENLEKEGNCPTLQGRVDHLVNGDFGMKGNFGLDQLKGMLVDLTETVNGNRVFSHGDKLPLRSFYSMQINRTPSRKDLESVYSFIENGMPDSSYLSERAYVSRVNYSNFLTNGSKAKGAEELRESYLASMEGDSKMLDALRRSPMFRILMQEDSAFSDDEAVSEVSEEFMMLWMDDGASKIEDSFFDQAVALGLKGEELQIKNWPEDLRTKYNTQMKAYNDSIVEKGHRLLNDPRLIQAALKAQNQNCKEMFDPKNIKQLFCEKLVAPENIVRERIIPEVIKHFDVEKDSMAIAEANNEVFCKGLEDNEETGAYEALNLSKAYPSFLEQISNGSSQEFAFYNEKVAPALEEFLAEDIPYTEKRKVELIEKLSAIDGLSDKAIQEMVNRPVSDSRLHDQDTLDGIFTESEDKEEGVVSNYALGANEKDRENARIVNQEIIAAREEGREVNQDILNEHGYKVRNLRDGSLSQNPGIVRPGLGLRGRPQPPGNPLPSPPPRRPSPIISDDDSSSQRENFFRPEEVPADFSESLPIRSQGRTPSSLESASSFNDSYSGGQNNAGRRLSQADAAFNRLQSSTKQSLGTDQLGNEVNQARDRKNQLQVANDFQERLNEIDRRRGVGLGSGNSRQGGSSGYTVPGFGGSGNSASSSYMNPYTNPDGVDRFPAADEDRLATGGKKGAESRQGGATGGSTEGGALALAGGPAGVGPVSSIPGFEGESVSDCAIPNLYYVLQCYLSDKVFREWSYLDEFSDEDEFKEARENPRELVKNLGFEGKAFIIVTPYKEDEQGRKQLLVTTYDYVPQMLEDVDKMNDESYRQGLLSQILAERWNFLAMRDHAKRTKIIEEQLYVEGDFLVLAEERKLKPMISSTAGELYNNVAKMNLRIRSENKTKIFDLRKKLSSRR
jgi:hypothetical protein